MKEFFDWLDTVTFSIKEGIAITVTILLILFFHDILKAYRIYLRKRKLRKNLHEMKKDPTEAEIEEIKKHLG